MVHWKGSNVRLEQVPGDGGLQVEAEVCGELN